MARPFMLVALLITAVAAQGCATETDPEGEDDAVATDAAELESAKPIAAFFDEPKPGGRADTIERRLIALIERASRGSEIRVAYYHFSNKRVADALITASRKRNVDVRIVLNDPSPDEDEDDHADMILARLRAGLPKGAVTVCKRDKGACIGTHINHNKFILFSELKDGTKNVVMQSSANLGSGRLHNNMLVFRNSGGLYHSYVGYFGDLVRQKKDLSYDLEMKGQSVRALVSPISSGDPVVSALDDVRCKAGESRVRVAMALFTGERAEIAKRLVDLKAKGCDVEVLARESGKGTAKVIVDILQAGSVPVRFFPSATGNNIHSKYLLIDSPLGAGGKSRRLVFTGSHNYTGEALRHNDEVLMRVEDDDVFKRFMANWRTVREQTR
jgi:phosphatidylserine/phosphatidylglycerophosphate/cardiolipin synthase-like enzyme